MDLNQITLRKTLQENENIDLYTLSKHFHCSVDDVLLFVQDNVLPDFRNKFKTNMYKIPFFTTNELETFFTDPVVDLGFLCQHHIKEISEQLKDKHNIMAHMQFYNNWLMYRGY